MFYKIRDTEQHWFSKRARGLLWRIAKEDGEEVFVYPVSTLKGREIGAKVARGLCGWTNRNTMEAVDA